MDSLHTDWFHKFYAQWVTIKTTDRHLKHSKNDHWLEFFLTLWQREEWIPQHNCDWGYDMDQVCLWPRNSPKIHAQLFTKKAKTFKQRNFTDWIHATRDHSNIRRLWWNTHNLMLQITHRVYSSDSNSRFLNITLQSVGLGLK